MFNKLFGKRMLWLFLPLLIASLLAPAAGWASESAGGGAWPQFQNDLYNDGLTSDQAPASTHGVGVAWQQQIGHDSMGAGINSTPLVAGGNVFVLDALGKTWAFDAKTGTQKWATQLSSTSMKFQLATPAYDNGTLYVATNDGHVYALDAASGSIRWHVPLTLASPYSQLDTPVKYAGGKIYIGGWNSDAGSDEYYYCLKADDGDPGIGTQYRVPNSATPGGYYWAGACIVDRCLIFGSERSVVTCLDKDTGALLSSVGLEVYGGAKEIRSSVSHDPATNMIFLTDQGGSCWGFSLEPATGKLTHKWHTSIGKISTSTPAVFNGRLYVGTGTYASIGGLYCLNELTGNTLWNFMLTGEADASVPGVQASPAVSVQNGAPYIYFVTQWEQSSVFCLDQDGNQVWQYQYGNPTYTTASIAVADGWLYFGNDAGWLYALKEVVVPVTGVDLNKTSDTIAIGGIITLTATVTPPDASNKSIAWTSSDTSVATVDATGKVTGVAVGVAAITATTADGAFAATCAVTVTSGGGGNPPGAGTITVKLTIQDKNTTTRFNGNVSVQAGKTVMDVLQAAAQTDPAMNLQVDWDNPHITGGYVESLYGEDSPWGKMSEGWVFFVNGVFANKGAARYKVSDGDNILWQWSAMAGVQGAAAGAATVPVTGVALNKTTATITVGGSDTLTATITPADAGNKSVTWTSDNTVVATVDQDGKVTAVAAGAATITATTADGAYKATCAVTVQAQQFPQQNQQPTQSPGASAFKDLPPGYWAVAAIECLTAGGYLKGYDDGTFRPDQPVTRAEFAAMLVHVMGMPDASGTEAFSDVRPGDWYYGVVSAGLSGGLISGYSDDRFGPDEPVTREQVASMLGRALARKEGQQTAAAQQTEVSLQFKDTGEISDWARSAVAMLIGRDLAHGYEDGSFRPKAPATRAECAVMLRKLLP